MMSPIRSLETSVIGRKVSSPKKPVLNQQAAAWPVKMRPIRNTETSVLNQPKPRNIPENEKIQVNRVGSLRSHKHCFVSREDWMNHHQQYLMRQGGTCKTHVTEIARADGAANNKRETETSAQSIFRLV